MYVFSVKRSSPFPLSLFQWKVRRTLAFSIHELAVILGDQLTAADLVPIFNGFLKDLDEVRIGVLKHLYDFLKVGLEEWQLPGRLVMRLQCIGSTAVWVLI